MRDLICTIAFYGILGVWLLTFETMFAKVFGGVTLFVGMVITIIYLREIIQKIRKNIHIRYYYIQYPSVKNEK